MGEEQGMIKPSSPGRAITKGKDERPGSLEFSQQPPQPLRRPSPHQMFPPQMQPPSNPLMYLQNNPLGPVSHTVLSKYQELYVRTEKPLEVTSKLEVV